MQQMPLTEDLWNKLEQLTAIQQETVATFIDSMLASQSAVANNDKRLLLTTSVWSESEIKHITDAQDRINEWQLPAF